MFVADAVADAGVSHRIAGSSVVMPTSAVVDPFMAPVPLPIVPPLDPAVAAVRSFLSQKNVAVLGFTCMSDAMERTSSMVKVSSVVPDETAVLFTSVAKVPAIEVFVPLETETNHAVTALGSTAEVAHSEVITPNAVTVSGDDFDLDEIYFSA